MDPLLDAQDSYNQNTDPLSALKNVDEQPLQDDDAIKRRSNLYGMGKIFNIEDNNKDIFDNLQEAEDTAENTIRTIGEVSLRQEAEAEAMAEDIQKYKPYYPGEPDSETMNYARQGLQLSIQERASREAKEEAERKWAENLVALRANGKEVQAELMIMEKETPNAFDRYVDIYQSQAMMMRAIEDAGVATKDRNWFLWAADAAMYLLPVTMGPAHEGTFDTDPASNNFWDTLFSGNRFNAETNNYWNAMLRSASADDRKVITDRMVKMVGDNVNTAMGPNELLRMQILGEYLNTPSATELDFWNMLDWLPTAGTVLRPVVTAPFKIANTLARSGNKARLVDLLEKTMKSMEDGKEMAAFARGQVGLSMDDVADAALPQPVNPRATVHADTAAGAVARDRLEAGRLLVEEMLGDLPIIQRLNEAEKAAALADVVKRAEKIGILPGSKRKRIVLNQSIESEVHAGSEINRVTMTLGKAGNKAEPDAWYANEKEALKRGRRMGFTERGPDHAGTMEAVKIDGTEGWGIKVSLPIDETGKALGGARIFQPLADKLKAGPFAMVARYLGSGKIGASEELFGSALLSDSKRNRIIATVNKEMIPDLYNIGVKDRELLGATLSQASNRELWHTEEQLRVIYGSQNGTSADASKFIKAYQTAVNINDMEYYLRNLEQLVTLSSQGYEKVSWKGIKGSGVNGKVFRSLSEVPGEVVYDVQKGVAYVQKEGDKLLGGVAPRLTKTELEDLQAKGWVIVRTQEPQDVFVGMEKGKARYFLMEGKDLKVDKLDFTQVPYNEGGHRMYQAQYFVKKMRTGSQPWGDEYLDSPFTPTAARTRAEGIQWADGMNKIQELYNKHTKAGMADDMMQLELQKAIDNLDDTHVSYPDADEFMDWMKKEGSEHPFEAVYDRENPSGYAAAKMKVPEEFWGEELTGINTYMQTQGRMFISGKGAVLRNIRDWDKPADVLDPYETLTSALSQIARMGSMQDFKIRAVQKWISTYGKVLNLSGMETMNPMRIFMEARFSSAQVAGNQAIIDAAELQRSFIKRTLGWKSEIDVKLEMAQRRIAEWAGGDNPGMKAKIVNSLGNWWNDTRPVNSFMGMAYDLTLGMFNPRQWPLQIQTSFAAASIDVTKGGQAMANMPAVWWYMRNAGTDKDLGHAIKMNWHKAAGFKDPKEYIAMMKALKNSGWVENALAAIKNDHGPNAAMSMFGKGVNDFRQAGRFFVETAEEWNRIVAWQMAWRLVRENPGNKLLKTASPAFVEKVQSLSSTLAGNMDRVSAAAWQKNVFTKIPTQFMSYMARWHEMALNKDLTTVQKFRYYIGQGLQYGVNGLPIVAPIAAMMAAKEGSKPDISSAEGMAYRGFWDSLIFMSTGADVGFSDSAGIGMQPTDLVAGIMGAGRFGSESMADIALGASMSITGNFYTTLWELLKNSTMQMTGNGAPQLTEASFHEFARSISSLNNAYKAYYILNQGRLTNRKGETIMDGLPSQYALMAIFGLSPEEMQEQTARMAWLGNRKDEVAKLSEQLVKLRADWGVAFRSGNTADAEKLSAFISEFRLKMVPSHLLEEVDNLAEKDDGYTTVIEGVTERVTEAQQQDRLIEKNKAAREGKQQ